MKFRITLFIGFWIMFWFFTQGQDMIVTLKGDTISCKIIQIKSNLIHYSFVANGRIIERVNRVSELRAYRQNYAVETALHSEAKVDSIDLVGDKLLSKKTRLAIQAGWGYRLNRVLPDVPPDVSDYFKQLKSGFQFSGDFHFFLRPDLGIGIKYSSFTRNGELTFDGTKYTDKIRIEYYGISLMDRTIVNNEGNSFFYTASLGYITYKNNATVGGQNLNFFGETIGVLGEFGYDIKLDAESGIGFLISLMLASIDQFNINGNIIRSPSPDQNEGLVRLDFSVGLRF